MKENSETQAEPTREANGQSLCMCVCVNACVTCLCVNVVSGWKQMTLIEKEGLLKQSS